jgi:hypothetical protein
MRWADGCTHVTYISNHKSKLVNKRNLSVVEVNICFSSSILKAFEDLEFRQLEEEAGWLAGHEELQRELVDMAARVDARGLRLRELEQQRLEAARSAQEESHAMERQVLTYLRLLEEVRQFLLLSK